MAGPTILSLQHSCQPSGTILCFKLPQECPVCWKSLSSYPLKAPPVRYPPVLQSSSSHPYSVIIKPTRGTFLGDYKNGDNLHCGVTDSKGFLCHFNEQGIHYDSSSWHQSLVIPLLRESDMLLTENWDHHLIQIIQRADWTSERYVELGHNCFDFVVAFLNSINYNYLKNGSNSLLSRQLLINEFILPTTSKAVKYIHLLKSIQAKGFLLQLNE